MGCAQVKQQQVSKKQSARADQQLQLGIKKYEVVNDEVSIHGQISATRDPNMILSSEMRYTRIQDGKKVVEPLQNQQHQSLYDIHLSSMSPISSRRPRSQIVKLKNTLVNLASTMVNPKQNDQINVVNNEQKSQSLKIQANELNEIDLKLQVVSDQIFFYHNGGKPENIINADEEVIKKPNFIILDLKSMRKKSENICLL